MPLGIFRKAARPSAFVRNRPFLRSPVMDRLDELFSDPKRNSAIYERVLNDRPEHLDAGYVSALFEEFSPDAGSSARASAADVIEHVFGHILGDSSWWGREGASWSGTRLFAAAYLDAMARAQAAGNVPIKTFHNQHSPDGKLQLHVLDAGGVIVVVVMTPSVPGVDRMAPVPVLKRPPRAMPTEWPPRDHDMPEISAFTHETM
jgi:hypothetical protein